jgi:hypothetical protein
VGDKNRVWEFVSLKYFVEMESFTVFWAGLVIEWDQGDQMRF